MPPLNDPKHQLKEGIDYTFARIGRRYGITLGQPSSKAVEGIIEPGIHIPNDAGIVRRDKDVLIWSGRAAFFELSYGIPRKGEREATVDIASEVFPKNSHVERR